MARPINLRSLNLNLLPVLRELLREKNVTRAAAAVGLSQSATSAALAKLRALFRDELLVMVGREMRLTKRGEALAAQIDHMMGELEAFLEDEKFEPARLTRRFTIATSDFVTFTLGPAFAERVTREAPGVSVFFAEPTGKTFERVVTGDVDCAIGASYVIDQPDLQSVVLYREEFVCIAGKDNKAVGDCLSEAEYFDHPHASYALGGQAQMRTAERLIAEKLGGEQKNMVLLPQAIMLPHFVGTTPCIALVHRRLFERARDVAGIREVKLTFELPKLDICAYWGANNQKERSHQWFRGLLREVAAGLR